MNKMDIPYGDNPNSSQRGMAAFAVTGTIVLVVLLIVTGFSLVARRTTQQALDRQLAQQATRTAEAGIDMAAAVVRKMLSSGMYTPATLPDKSNCGPDASGAYATLPNFPDIDTKVTCLLVQRGVDTLKYSGVDDISPTVVDLSTQGGNLGSINIRWYDKNEIATPNPPGVGCTDDSSYSRVPNVPWACKAAILRLDIAKRSSGDTNEEANTVFVYPYKAASGVTTVVSYGDMRASWAKGACNGTICQVTISGLPATDAYMAVRSLYVKSEVEINGTQTGSSQPALFLSQVLVDSTARSVDVIKRLRANVNVGFNKTGIPGYAVESSEAVCKKFVVNQYEYSDAGGCGY